MNRTKEQNRPFVVAFAKSWLLRLLGALLSGALFAAALPPGVAGVLGWVAFVPLFLAVRNTRFIVGFALGLIAVFACAFFVRRGFFFPGAVEVGTDGWIYSGIGLFGIIISLLSGVLAEHKHLSTTNVLAMAALAALLEGGLLFVLPAHIALTNSQSWALLTLSSVTGIWGASFVMWAVNIALTEAVANRSLRQGAPGLFVACFCSIPFLGDSAHVPPNVAVVQTVLNEEEQLARLNLEAGKEGAVLAVWPEFGGQMMAPKGDASAIRALSAVPGQPAIVTSFPDANEPLPYNVAALYSEGTESERYRKRRLFGGENNMHTPGTKAVAAPFQGGQLGLNICFDSCYPYVIRDTASITDVRLIALPTIDPESPHHFVAAIHAAFTPFRAAENGVPMVRADGVAYSQVVDSRGRIVMSRPPGEAVASAGVRLERRFTVYRLLGDWFLWAAGVMLIGLLVTGRRAAGRREVEVEAVAEEEQREPVSR